jgi:hypothetical protein
MFVVCEIDGERRIFKLEVPAFSIRAFCTCAIYQSGAGCMRRPRARARRSRRRHGGSRCERGPPGDDGDGPPAPPQSAALFAGRQS